MALKSLITVITGYMDRHLFREWFQRIFLQNCGSERPVLLLLDNHDSHISYDVLDMAMKNQVNCCYILTNCHHS